MHKPLNHSDPSWVPQRPQISQVGESSAMHADALLGAATGDPVRMLAPQVGATMNGVTATFKALFTNPLSVGRGRAEHLAKLDRSFDVNLTDGSKLRALDAYSGEFMIHLMPPAGSRDTGVHIALPTEGNEANAVVQTDPHSPDSPVGFYNLREATAAGEAAKRIVDAAAAAPAVSLVNQQRAKNLGARLALLLGYLGRLERAMKSHPELVTLRDAAGHAYGTKAPGDAADKAYVSAVQKVSRLLRTGSALSPELQEQVREDLATLAADRNKWQSYHGSSIHSYYLSA